MIKAEISFREGLQIGTNMLSTENYPRYLDKWIEGPLKQAVLDGKKSIADPQ